MNNIEARRKKREERMKLIKEQEESFGENVKEREFLLHVAPHFLIQKSSQEQEEVLRKNGFTFSPDKVHGIVYYHDPKQLPQEIREQLWKDARVSPNGFFTFQPNKLYLSQTAESVAIPQDETWRMRKYFQLKSTGEELPLFTNSAAQLMPGSSGHQVFEIFNDSDKPITVAVADMACIIDVLRLSSPASRITNQFSEQQIGRIRLGKL